MLAVAFMNWEQRFRFLMGSCVQTTVKKKKKFSPQTLYIPYKWYTPHPCKKFFLEKSFKIPSRGHPRIRTAVSFKAQFSDNFVHSVQIKRRNFIVQIHAPGWKKQIPVHSLSGGCPKIVCANPPTSGSTPTTPSHSKFTADYHIWHLSWAWT